MYVRPKIYRFKRSNYVKSFAFKRQVHYVALQDLAAIVFYFRFVDFCGFFHTDFRIINACYFSVRTLFSIIF